MTQPTAEQQCSKVEHELLFDDCFCCAVARARHLLECWNRRSIDLDLKGRLPCDVTCISFDFEINNYYSTLLVTCSVTSVKLQIANYFLLTANPIMVLEISLIGLAVS